MLQMQNYYDGSSNEQHEFRLLYQMRSPLGNTIQNTLNNIQNIVVPTVNNTCQSVHQIINNPLC